LCSLKNTVCSTANAIFSFARLSPARSVTVLKVDDTNFDISLTVHLSITFVKTFVTFVVLSQLVHRTATYRE
jgi:hypothetical protein